MTAFTDEVRETVSPHKFGGDRMAAACWLIDLDGSADETTGDASEWQFYAARIGKRILVVDDQGFVTCERYAGETSAMIRFEAIESDYGAHLDALDAEDELWRDGFQPESGAQLDEFEPGSTVRVEGYNGVAWRVITAPARKGPDYDWSGILWVNPSQRVCHMVGDDREHLFDVDELRPLGEDEFCSSCGQIGCGWC